jgi:hypothetical protein
VTRYAIDEERGLLLASWSTGTGDTAAVVAELPPRADKAAGLRLAAALSELSDVLWRCYTHPASATLTTEPNTEGWRRDLTRKAFTDVLPALAKPSLPDGDGSILMSYDPVEEGAHRTGRALHAIGGAGLTRLVTAEVGAELEAVERAERGDLSGRARQAVALTRADASPAQVAAADRLLHDDPLDGAALMTDVDPAAAAVAAAHWLKAAADVAAGESGLEPEGIVHEADNIEALACETPTLVLAALADGLSPHAVVTGLIQDAMTAAEGRLPALGLLDALAEHIERLAPHTDLDDPGQREQFMDSLRVTPLDPARPAPDLLEDLLAGIHGCWLVYQEYAGTTGTTEPAGATDGDWPDEPDEPDESEHGDAYYEAQHERLRTGFADAVRAAAQHEHDRLL